MKTSTTKKAKLKADLAESADDKKHMQPDKATLDLPDVKDIPGQEHVRPLLPGEMADITISSADEEAEALLGTADDELSVSRDTNVSPQEKELLRRSSESMGTEEDEALQRAALDNTDEDGTPLNEAINLSGDELDVPGSEDDDANEEIGEEDEENNSFSLPDQDEK